MANLPKKTKHIPKYIHALTYFVNQSMNRLEAQRLYGDTYLNSTVSELSIEHGVSFRKLREPHINQVGRRVRYTRYWLADESKERARQLIKPYLPSIPR